jgi:SAM-dependent methyltransferase
MKFQYNYNPPILITLKPPKNIQGVEYIGEFENISFYYIKSEDVFNKLMKVSNAVRYLDSFVLILPHDYNKQKMLWSTFYHVFGKRYEELVDKEHNIECIRMMLCQIMSGDKFHDNFKILDYGCGSGLSLLCEYGVEIVGFEPEKTMRHQAQQKGMMVFDENNIQNIPNEYFDAIFSSYVFHMGISETDIKLIIPKMKPKAVWIANYYKNINENIVNKFFLNNGFASKRVDMDERFGHVYAYQK